MATISDEDAPIVRGADATGMGSALNNQTAHTFVSRDDTRVEISPDKCIHQLFEEQVKRTPNALAVTFENEWLSFRELDERADDLAGALQHLGIGPDMPVGICVERSLEMMVGVLGILKADGCYVPLDPAYPNARLMFMLADAQPLVLLTQTSLVQKLQFAVPNLKSLCLDAEHHAPRNTGNERRKTVQSAANLAYVIYTSGSTGKPKGVAMPHRPLVRLIDWQLHHSRLGAGARTLQFASLSFDVSFQEMFATWCTGGTLVLVDEKLRRDSAALLRFIIQQKIERLFLPFIALQQFAEACSESLTTPSSLREIVTAGEQLQITPNIVKLFQRLPQCTLDNHYGPSESHVVTAFTLRGPPDGWPALPPIGRPIPSARIYLLDEQRQLVAPGEAGEINIGGDCLARGYLHQPELTDEKFVPDHLSNDPQAKLYKTGDLGRLKADGEIEFLGRMDHQVKIRGFRIELGEIEATLRLHPDIRDAVVVAREDEPGHKRLMAYYICRRGTTTPSKELRRFLSEKLPEYMVPAKYILLETVPLTSSGKVDRVNLPAPAPEANTSEDLAAPRTQLEESLVAIWCKVLDFARIGIHDNFFDLGGHSLLAVQLFTEIEGRLRIKVPIVTIFQSPTIEQLAKSIEQQAAHTSDTGLLPIQPVGDQPPLFLVHGAGGDVLWGYANLAHHTEPDRPIYGIQACGAEEFSTLEEMAAQYVDRMRAFQPIGPYHLGGYCFGGNVAQEMARQLEGQGESVALLALLDCASSNGSYETLDWRRPTWVFDFTRNLYYWLGDFLHLKPEERRSLVLRKLQTLPRKAWRRISGRQSREDFDLEEFIDLTNVSARETRLWRNHLQLLGRHVSKPYRGHLTLFRTRSHPLVCSFENDFGWSRLATNVTVKHIPGSHEGIFIEPHVRGLAGKLSESLRSAHQESLHMNPDQNPL